MRDKPHRRILSVRSALIGNRNSHGLHGRKLTPATVQGRPRLVEFMGRGLCRIRWYVVISNIAPKGGRRTRLVESSYRQRRFHSKGYSARPRCYLANYCHCAAYPLTHRRSAIALDRILLSTLRNDGTGIMNSQRRRVELEVAFKRAFATSAKSLNSLGDTASIERQRIREDRSNSARYSGSKI